LRRFVTSLVAAIPRNLLSPEGILPAIRLHRTV
jgi:hypothetical protein